MQNWKRAWLALLVAASWCSLAPGQVTINEIRIDQTGADNDEYFELAGPPLTDLSPYTYLVIGDGAGGSGVIEVVVPLTGQAINALGFFLVTEATFGAGAITGTPDLILPGANPLNFENNDNLTHLLVEGFTGANADDLDTNDDGVLDVTPWTSIVDLIALVLEPNPPTGTEYHYGPPEIGPDGLFVPGHVFRCPDGSGAWQIGPFDPTGGQDTSGAPNACSSCLNPQGLSCVPDCVTGNVQLTWTNPVAYTSITVLRDGVPFAPLGGGDTSFTDVGVPTNMSYTYQVIGDCMGTPSNPSTCNVNHCPCLAASALSCVSDCITNDVSLTWTNNQTYTGIVIRRNGSVVGSVPGTATSFTDMAAPDGIYTYDVEVTCAAGLGTTSCSVFHCVTTFPPVVINEIVTDQPGSDDEEYFELSGPPAASLAGLSYIVLGDIGANGGVVEAIVDLSPYSLDANGLFWAAELDFNATMPPCQAGSLMLCGTPNLVLGVGGLNFENDDNVTHMLVFNFTGTLNQDLDLDDDGVLEITPWAGILDCVALLGTPSGGDPVYCTTTLGPDASCAGTFVPSHSIRCTGGLSPNPWRVGDFGSNFDDTPGASNFCPDCFEIEDLTASTDCVTGNLTLNWVNGDNYVGITVFRNAVSVATLPGSATTFSEVLPAGNYSYQVIGICALGDTTAELTLYHGVYNGETNVIFSGEGRCVGGIDSALALQVALDGGGQNSVIIGQLDGYACLAQLGPGDILWVCNGTFPDKYFMTAADGAALVSVLSAGASIYIEGAGTFVYDPATPFDDYDGIDNSARMTGVGGLADDSLTTLNGMSFSNLNLTAFQGVVYNQDNLAGNDYNDTLIPAGTTMADIPDGTAGPIWANNPDDPMNPELPYVVGLYFKTDGPNGASFGDVITSTFEFGGFGGDQIGLAAAYSTALRRVDNPPVGTEFIRGRCNGDSSVNIADAVFLLGFLFPGGNPPNVLDCRDACDANDDGSLNIADVIRLLGALFGSPTVPLPPPNTATGCGVDPTDTDALDCAGPVPAC